MDQGAFVWMAILSIAQVVNIVASIASMRRKPSLSEELYRDFVSRNACDARHARLATERSENVSTFQARLDKGDEQFRNIERALGRIEGKIEQLSKERKP